MILRVINVGDKSECACKCGSWLRHWERFTRLDKPSYCPINHCMERGLVGAHVKKAESSDDQQYVVPLCREHSKATGILTLPDWCDLAPANVEKTCG